MLRWIIGLCIGVALICAPVYAQEPVAAVVPPPTFDHSRNIDYVSYNGDPDGAGTIDRIDAEGVVLNDFGIDFTPSTTYHIYNGGLTTHDFFKVGMAACYYLDAERKRVASLWECRVK